MDASCVLTLSTRVAVTLELPDNLPKLKLKGSQKILGLYAPGQQLSTAKETLCGRLDVLPSYQKCSCLLLVLN